MPFDDSGLLVPGAVGPQRPVPHHIPRPEYVGRPGPRRSDRGDVYDFAEIARIRESGRIAARAVEAVGAAIRPGVTTDHLDEVAHDFLVAHDAYPSTLGYRGFPKSSCTSINEVVCHGIPDDTVLRDGDLVNIDITAYVDGMHGDLNATFLVGDAAPEVVDLVDRTREALNRGIKAVAPGRQINVIGRAIESYARRFGYGVVRDYTGHGVGATFHSGLVIPHWDDPSATTVMEPGMVFTIEPMLTISGEERWDLWADDWTVVTRDRSLTAQFEHTMVVTERGAELLTLP
ncbi:type I methionyl aminopeptidase [Schumannella sp. 10F1B-5-1]|uniref:type I methionyl aminopeptidase n=1 Tax=Schumannella sp. 10F1B-5-1 TaxID=2590780 RepID=UPI0011322E37|nr:type I methionyl aminopeptidase [Schumannella sp. 10F1B-5-1]TPW70849.1 type I methionyl aminopeptidase [Schumannella sp. 10F1B-5-1]